MLGYFIAIVALLLGAYLLYKIHNIKETHRKEIELLERKALLKELALKSNNTEIQERLTEERTRNERLQSKVSNTKCLLCQAPSDAKHFCYICYQKYKNRSIDVRIKECISAEIIDPYGNLSIRCDDGRKVRSRAEALISNFLYNNKIRFEYEKEIHTQENGQDKILQPDFYLPDYNLYIEYNEITDTEYIRRKEYAQKIYNRLGLKVIIMDDKDLNNIAGFLKPKLGIN